MREGDPRFATYPAEPGIQQLRWYIRQTAAGALTVDEFLRDFRRVHESAERAGAVAYASDEESRAVWDVLWAMEFAATDRTPAEEAEEQYIPAEVLAVIQRAAKHLAA
jgi:hypothetical protein